MNWRRPFVHPVLITPAICLVSCVTCIVPPEAPSTPASVFLLDYGLHSSLVLPDPAHNSLIEYAYGDWNWFALDKSNWYHVFPTLWWPTRGAMGRRRLHINPDAADIRRVIVCEQVLEIVVNSHDAIDLSAQLRSQFDQHRDSLHFQPLYGLTFVHSDRAFHLFHNCNHVVADWLGELGCKVRGPAILADFAVKRSTVASSGVER